MADTPLTIYRRRLAELLKSIDQGNADLQSIHAELSQTIIAELRKEGASNTNALKLQQQFDRAFEKSLPKRVRIVRERIEEGAKVGRKAAQQTVRVQLGDKVERAHVRATAKSLSEASERIAGRITVDGKSLGKRMRGVDKEVAGEMAREVQNGIQQRNGILGAARKIEKLDPREAHLPKYLEELTHAAKRGSVDEVKKLAASYTKRISQLGEIQQDGTFTASKYSLRSATQKFVAKVQTASADGIDKLVKKYVDKRLAWRANTIARSESVEAMRQSYVEQAKNKPGVVAFAWKLSNRHEGHGHGGAKQDVCDLLANQNAYGLGPGRYPKDKVPTLPHSNCLCNVVAVFDDKHFERADNDQGQVPADMRDAKSPDALGWLKQNDAAAAKILGPTRHAMLKQGRTDVLDATGRPRLVRDLLAPRTRPQVQKLAAGSSYVPDAVGSRVTASSGARGPVAQGQKPPKGSPKIDKVTLPKAPVANAPEKVAKPKATPKPKTPKHKPAAQPVVPSDGLHLPDAHAREVAQARVQARAAIQKHGLTLNEAGPGSGEGLLLPEKPGIADKVLGELGMRDAHRAWLGQGPAQQGWFVDSTNANGALGKWLVGMETEAEEIADLIKETGFAGKPNEVVAMARAQYATTQELLAQRLAGKGIAGVDKDGYVTLYRGIKERQGQPLRKALAAGQEHRLPVRSLSSWTTDADQARGFTNYGGAVVKQRVHVSRVFAQWEHADISSRVYGEEAEWVLVFPDEAVTIRPGDIVE